MSLEKELKDLRTKASLEGDLELQEACEIALKKLPSARRKMFEAPPKKRQMRHNPPLLEHMAEESYDAIFHALAQRIMRGPENAIEFAYDVISTAKEGLLRYQPGSLEEDEESALGKIEEHLDKALAHIQKALYIMEE